MKVVVVTGGTRGLGLAIVRRLLEEDYRLVAVGRNCSGELSSLVQENPGRVSFEAYDFAETAGIHEFALHLGRQYGRIYGLVNNAALNYYIPTADYPTSRWIKAFAVNVHAPFILSKAVLPDMIAAGRGAIVNISSGSAIGPGRGPYADQTVRGGVMYGASKAAVAGGYPSATSTLYAAVASSGVLA